MKTFKVLSALLSYPTQGLIDAAPDFPAILDAEAVVPAAVASLDLLIEEIATGEVYDLQERYGLLFDRSKTLALHLFEHVHGESRDRGQAMVDLKAMYEKAGLSSPPTSCLITCRCSSNSCRPGRSLRPVNCWASPPIFLRRSPSGSKRQSNYEAVFDALVAISAAKPSREIVDACSEARSRPDGSRSARCRLGRGGGTVRAGSRAGACGHEGLIAKLRHARRAVDPAPRPQ